MSRFRILGFAVALMAAAQAVSAQPQLPPRIWDIPLGTHVSALPKDEFVDAACGTHGGPPGVSLGGFENFARCPEEPSGLREVWFIYDDELEYVARAVAPSAMGIAPGVPAIIAEDRLVVRYRATQVMLHPVILSYLVDRDGRVQGFRVLTDPRSDPELRLGASSVAITFKGRYGLDGWSCVDLPPAEGERPMGSPPRELFIKERCEKTSDGRKIVTESRQYYKPGQTYLDPLTGKPTDNEFESRSTLEVVSLTPIDKPAESPRPGAPGGTATPADDSPRATFIAGKSLSCPGCDLSGLNFKRRDLGGADLRGANLTGTSFHRAILRAANLSGANLHEANLNRTVLTNADLRGATLTGALLYQAEAGRANFSGANLNDARLRRVRVAFGNFSGADLTLADLEDARLSQASFRNAKLSGANLYLAVLNHTDLQDMVAESAVWAKTNMRATNLSRSVLRGSDLMDADLAGANLAGADLGQTRLHGALLSDTDQTGTIFTGALMPNNTTAP
jgi:uncharacterized protein YjbI with pentapeptide repeats